MSVRGAVRKLRREHADKARAWRLGARHVHEFGDIDGLFPWACCIRCRVRMSTRPPSTKDHLKRLPPILYDREMPPEGERIHLGRYARLQASWVSEGWYHCEVKVHGRRVPAASFRSVQYHRVLAAVKAVRDASGEAVLAAIHAAIYENKEKA